MANAARQIPFDLDHRMALGRDDFLITPNNQDAVAWIDLWPNWPAPVLVIYGPQASGKSHLSSVWSERSGAVCIAPSHLNDGTAREISALNHNLILDNADHIIGSLEEEKGLFHLYNIFKEEGRNILLILQNPPVRRSFALPDLASRLRAAPTVAIREPDEYLLGAIMVKQFRDRQVRVGQDVINYILPRIERSFSAVQDIVEKADRKALEEKRALSVPLIRDILTMDASSQ